MRTLASLLTVAALLGGCSTFSDFSASQLANDVTMTTTLKSRLATTEGLNTLTGVHIRTTNDMVYLTGRVPDAATRARIDALMRDVAGDNRVTNELTVKAAQASAKSD